MGIQVIFYFYFCPQLSTINYTVLTMYPNLRYAFYDIFGIDIPMLGLIQSFGFWMAMAFVVSALWLTREFKRREKEGILHPHEEKYKVGVKFSAYDAVSNALLGFFLGFKGLYIALNPQVFAGDNAKDVLFSWEGYWLVGILLAAAMVGWRYWERKKENEQYPEEKELSRQVFPHQHVGDIIVIAAISGIAGAKLLYLLENLNELSTDPFGAIFSGSGLTVYGGLILAAFTTVYYTRRWGIPTGQLLDTAAPTMMFAYGVGRLGCHFSGDGDWGDPNPNPDSMPWLPNWMWAYRYPNNVLEEGIKLEECGYPADFGSYCTILEQPVYPTPVWEFMMATLIFGILFLLRRRVQAASGLLFCIYLIFNGLERFAIEVIRVNPTYQIFGLTIPLSQAQIIAIILFLIGVGTTIWKFRQLKKANT